MGLKIELRCGLEAHYEHITLLKASWRPLGALLEALGAKKKYMERPLAALREISRQVSAKNKV